MIFKLRDYQQTFLDNIRSEYLSGSRAVLGVLPTGGGKTIVFSEIARLAIAIGHRVLILVHRDELLRQASEKLTLLGISHGIIAAGYSPSGAQVQIASVQTFVRRMHKFRCEFHLIIIDEAHHSNATSWTTILSAHTNAHILGVTATPCRLDGKGLGVACGGHFETMVEGPSIRDLIDDGFLCQPITYGAERIDTSQIQIRCGDFVQDEVVKAIDKPKITGNAVEHYGDICYGLPAIAFCASVKHSQHVSEAFNRHGIVSDVMAGNMSNDQRKYKIQALASGKIKVLTACDMISEGTDIPVVSVGIMLRPTNSLSLHLQQGGRVLRMYEGKENAFILDHAGNWERFGLVDQVRSWSLEGVERKDKRSSEGIKNLRRCPKCFMVFSVGLSHCPQCGNAITAKEREIKHQDGKLKIITSADIEKKKARMEVGRLKTLDDLLRLADARGYKRDWAYHVHNSRKAKENERSVTNLATA